MLSPQCLRGMKIMVFLKTIFQWIWRNLHETSEMFTFSQISWKYCLFELPSHPLLRVHFLLSFNWAYCFCFGLCWQKFHSSCSDQLFIHILIPRFTLTRPTLTESLLLQKNWSFPLKVPSLNVTKFAVSCGFGRIYWRKPWWETLFFAQCSPDFSSLPHLLKPREH